jgi:uncharacterized protein DUF6916
MPTPLENLNALIFREHLHSKFNAHQEKGEAIPLELIDVVENDTSPKMEVFSLYFRGPINPRLGQQIHRLEHDKLGPLEIFLTPIEADRERGTVYECVFHRFRKS